MRCDAVWSLYVARFAFWNAVESGNVEVYKTVNSKEVEEYGMSFKWPIFLCQAKDYGCTPVHPFLSDGHSALTWHGPCCLDPHHGP